jgi:hypothetical protein
MVKAGGGNEYLSFTNLPKIEEHVNVLNVELFDGGFCDHRLY